MKLEGKKVEGFKLEILEILDIFFDGKNTKINTLAHVKGKKKATSICFNLAKDELYDFLLYADDLDKVLEVNSIANNMDIFTSKGIVTANNKISLQHRILVPQTGDIISFKIQPLVIKNITLDWNGHIADDKSMVINIENYYRE